MNRIRKDQNVMSNRIAIIDIGSNAIRCLVAEGKSFDRHQILFKERVSLRFGKDVFHSGNIRPDSQLKLIKILVEWRSLFSKMRVQKVRAVATAALRDSKNGRELAQEIKQACGIKIEIISGVEEGQILRDMVHYGLPNFAPKSLCMDIGGGSVEFSYQNKVESLPIGAVRVLESVTSVDEESIRLSLRPYLLKLRNSWNISSHEKAQFMIATGGNAKSLARLAKRLRLSKSKKEFSQTAIQKTIERLFSLSFKERCDQLKLSSDRADVVLPAACLVDETCRIFEISRVFAPQVGLKEGLLLDSFLKSNH